MRTLALLLVVGACDFGVGDSICDDHGGDYAVNAERMAGDCAEPLPASFFVEALSCQGKDDRNTLSCERTMDVTCVRDGFSVRVTGEVWWAKKGDHAMGKLTATTVVAGVPVCSGRYDVAYWRP